MNLPQLFMVVTGYGLPAPSLDGVTLADEAALIRAVLFPPPTPFTSRVLDIATPLLPTGVDVRGNAQHWLIRTADAALERTHPSWLARFEAEDAWTAMHTARTNPAFAGFFTPTKLSRRGLPLSVSTAKHDKRLLASYSKAVENWNRAFDNEGDNFYDQVVGAGERYAEATQQFLALVGLDIRHFKGAFSLHLMLMCGNVDAVRFIANNTDLLALSFAGAPFIPLAVRREFSQAIMAVLCRDLYLSLPQPDMEAINTRLDAILGAYVGGLYDGPPFSFCHVEHHDGGFYLHTVILFGTAPRPPVAYDWHVPLRQPVPPPGQVVLVPDIFAYGAQGVDAITSCTFLVEAYAANVEDTLIWLHRSDTMSLDTQLNYPVPNAITVPLPPGGTTWQIVLRTGSTPTHTLEGSLSGHFYYRDSAGLHSNRATWHIAGHAPRAIGFFREVSILEPVGTHIIVVPDLFAYGVPGSPPLAFGSIRAQFDQNNTLHTPLILRRTDGMVDGLVLNGPLGVLFDFAALPPGVRWELYVVGVNPAPGLLPVLIGGEFWFTDTAGNQSNRAPWVVNLSRQAP